MGMATRVSKCLFQEPGDSAVTPRRVVAKRPPTGDEEEEMRQTRLRSEPVPELFPLIGEELSEIVFEILIDLFASPWFRTL